MAHKDAMSLKEVQLRLGVPQHVLIHLCEKQVIEPDFAQASGRGKRREFSERNLFEFAVAMEIRRFEIPVMTTAVIVRLLRSFGRAVAKAKPDFELPAALVERGVRLSLHLYAGEHLIVEAEGRALARRMLVGFNLLRILENDRAQARMEKLEALPTIYDSHLELNLTGIAQRFFKSK